MTLVCFVVTSTLRDATPDYRAQVERDIEIELRRGEHVLCCLDGLDEVRDRRGLLWPVLKHFHQMSLDKITSY